MTRRTALFFVLAMAVVSGTPARGAAEVVLEERIAADPEDDLVLGVVLTGDIPAAVRTRGGVVAAPDPTRPPSASEVAPTPSESSTFAADRDTRRPDVLPYSDPFSPSVTPFKRLTAYDAVDSNFRLYVRDPVRLAMPLAERVSVTEERFFADLVVDVKPGEDVRVPSVAAGSKVLHARLGTGAHEVGFSLLRDGADNWFLRGSEAARARLVLDLAAPTEAFGGVWPDPDWSVWEGAVTVPENVAAAAEPVLRAIGVSRHDRPRVAIERLVAYHRGFVDSDTPPPAKRDIYTDLALAKKGVCRHRAYAFVVSALALGIPTRLVTNEAHAWVEVHDGHRFRRIDLGGAGNVLSTDTSRLAEPHIPPPDPYAWPDRAARGEDLANASRAGSARDAGATSTTASPRSAQPADPLPRESDGRPPTSLSIIPSASETVRGDRLRVTGSAKADGAPCARLSVEVWLEASDATSSVRIGVVATSEQGTFDATLLVPSRAGLGDQRLVARTRGDARCGEGSSP